MAGGKNSLFKRATASTLNDGRDATAGDRSRAKWAGDGLPGRLFAAETFELVRNLFLTPSGNVPRAVSFCAVESDSKCSWIAGQAAELLASQAIGSVCVVDAEVGRPSLNSYFGTENRPGLGEALYSLDRATAFARALSPEGLWVVTAGTLLERPKMDGGECRRLFETRVAELRESYEFLIVHAPPVLASPISIYLAANGFDTVLILQPSVTRQRSGREAREQIEAAGGRVLGVVLHRPTANKRQTDS